MNDEDIIMEPNYQEDDKEGITFIPEKGFYQPSTDESWEAYQALISMVQDQLGGFPNHVICGAADEVLSVLKSSILFGSRTKKIELEKLLGPIPDFIFDQLLVIGNLINDYNGTQNRDDQEGGFFIYRPTNEETWRNYNLFVDVVGQLVGVQDRTVLRLGADGILSVLKNEEIEKPEWKKEAIEYLHLGPISHQTFDHLCFMGTLITDYPKPPEPQSSQPQDLPSSSLGGGTDNLSMGPTVEFIKEENKFDYDSSPTNFWSTNFDDSSPTNFWSTNYDDSSPTNFWRTNDDEHDDDGEEKEIEVPEYYPTVKDDVNADDEMVGMGHESDDSSETAKTDETGSEIRFEKIDIDEVQSSNVEGEDWVVVAFESWKGVNDTTTDDDDDDDDDMRG